MSRRSGVARHQVECAFVALLVGGVLGACRTTLRTPDLGDLYNATAQGSHMDRNPVVLIPGVLGSTLRQHGSERIVWGSFTGDFADPGDADGARLVALPMARGVPLAELTDDVYASGALESLKVSFFGLPIDVSAYINILMAMGVGGYRDEQLGRSGEVDYGDDHFTCFQFAYDWRRDISENAVRFHEFLVEKEAYIVAETRRRYGIEREHVRFDVVAHSMGGLLLRYYLRYGAQALPADGSIPVLDWSGAERVGRAVLVGTPNAGSAQAHRDLIEGTKLDLFLPRYAPAIIGTMPAAYQLLARSRHGAFLPSEKPAERERVIDVLDASVWEKNGWGLAGRGQATVLEDLLPGIDDADERRQIALEHQRKCLARARQFFEAMDVPAALPDNVELFLAAGDAADTPSVVTVNASGERQIVLEYGPGDGTVLRQSALMDERPAVGWQPQLVSPIEWSRVMFFFEDHLGLTKDPAFIDNLLYFLLEDPSVP